MVRDQSVMRSWKSVVVRMWRLSGAHRHATSPAEPSSILHVQSGCSIDHTWGGGRRRRRGRGEKEEEEGGGGRRGRRRRRERRRRRRGGEGVVGWRRKGERKGGGMDEKIISSSYLHDSSLVHATHEEERVG